jgi:hypothetical protein
MQIRFLDPLKPCVQGKVPISHPLILVIEASPGGFVEDQRALTASVADGPAIADSRRRTICVARGRLTADSIAWVCRTVIAATGRQQNREQACEEQG